MKILVLCYEYPPIGGGGGRAAKAAGEELARLGHEVRFQTAGMAHLPARESINGVEVFRSRSFRRREEQCSVAEMGLFIATSFFPCLRHIREWRPDVIHAHFAVPTGALAYAVSLLTGVPYVITAHLGDVPGGVPEQTDALFRYLDPLIRPVWKRAAAVTAVSEFVRGLAEAAYGREAVRIPNGIPLGPEKSAAAKPGGTIRILGVGRMNPQKRFPFMIETLAAIRELDWRLDILGDGSERPRIEARIRELNLGDRVALHGWLGPDDVADRMAASDILLMTSSFEGLPVAAVEALARGLAIVASDIGGLRDLVDPGANGVLVPADDRAAFGAALGDLVSDRARLGAMKDASLVKAREFDIAAIGAAYERVLREAAGSRHA